MSMEEMEMLDDIVRSVKLKLIEKLYPSVEVYVDTTGVLVIKVHYDKYEPRLAYVWCVHDITCKVLMGDFHEAETVNDVINGFSRFILRKYLK